MYIRLVAPSNAQMIWFGTKKFHEISRNFTPRWKYWAQEIPRNFTKFHTQVKVLGPRNSTKFHEISAPVPSLNVMEPKLSEGWNVRSARNSKKFERPHQAKKFPRNLKHYCPTPEHNPRTFKKFVTSKSNGRIWAQEIAQNSKKFHESLRSKL